MSDFWSGFTNPPMTYRSIQEWQQLAISGQLQPDTQLYDPVRGIWQRAGDHPELRPYFPTPKVNWPAVLGLGTLAALAVAAVGSNAIETERGPFRSLRKERRMAKNNRVLVSFAVEDKTYRDFLVGQAKNNKSPFEFVDMSVKEPWDEKWKTNCRTHIRGCDAVIALVSKNTAKAEGALWEVWCAKEERVPVRGIYCTTDNRPATLPAEFAGVRVVGWTWDNIASFINSL